MDFKTALILWLKVAAIAIVGVLAPVKTMVVTSATLVIMDMFTGILASYKLKQPITSAGIRRTVSKLIIYTVAILIAFLAQTYLLENEIPACNWITGMIGLTELMSCLENLNTISGTNLLQSVIDRLGSQNK